MGRCQPCVSAHQLHTDATHCGAGERPGGAGGDGGEASRPRGSVQAEEVAKFTSHAAEWWDPLSKTFGPLHSMNAVRVPFIRRAVAAAARARDASAEGPGHAGTGSGAARGGHALAGVTVLDAGCGGGVLAEVRVARPCGGRWAVGVGRGRGDMALTLSASRCTRRVWLGSAPR